jgi:hypothetical protein
MNWLRSPHPVPLPLGEGTVRHPPSAIQASLLPGGEGQDEGSGAKFVSPARNLHYHYASKEKIVEDLFAEFEHEIGYTLATRERARYMQRISGFSFI